MDTVSSNPLIEKMHKVIWGVGSGASGLLCNSELDDKAIFIKVLELEKGYIKQLSLGGKKAILMTDDDTILEWGELEEKGKVVIKYNRERTHIYLKKKNYSK
jgi:hypothetical protein